MHELVSGVSTGVKGCHDVTKCVVVFSGVSQSVWCCLFVFVGV